MAQQRKHSNKKVSDFFDYILGKLSGKDRNAFERKLQKDPFEAEAAEGFAKVSREEAEHDLAHVASRIRSRIRRKRRIVWYSAAAAVASLMIVATIFFTVDDGSMDRYKTAPEFEEAAQEQPSGAVMERKQPRKDVIPDAEDLAKKEVIPDEQELQEGVIRDEEQVMQEELVQDPEELAKKDVIPDEQELQKGLIQDEDQVMQEGVIQDEERVSKEEMMNEEDRANKEDREQDMFDEKREAGANAAAELSKRAAPVTPDEPVIREFQQDEVPELEEMQPAQVKALEEEMPQQLQSVTTEQAVTRTQAASETLQGQVLGVHIAEPRQDEIPELEELQPLQEQVGEEKGLEPIHKQVRDASTSPSLQGQVAGVEVAQPLQDQVQGIVYSAENLEPLPGVSLFVKGTETGTVTDREGRFSLNTSEARGSTLVAAYIGMQTEEIPLDADQPMEIAMLPDAVQLDEVVVVGNTGTKKTMLTGAATKIDPDPVTDSKYITASPVDGIIQYNRYMDTTLVYPPAAGSGDKEVVVLKFSISPDGRPENFRLVRSPGEPFTEEAIRVISNGPDWNPTTRDGRYVDDDVRLRIVFRPE